MLLLGGFKKSTKKRNITSFTAKMTPLKNIVSTLPNTFPAKTQTSSQPRPIVNPRGESSILTLWSSRQTKCKALLSSSSLWYSEKFRFSKKVRAKSSKVKNSTQNLNKKSFPLRKNSYPKWKQSISEFTSNTSKKLRILIISPTITCKFALNKLAMKKKGQ